MKLELLVSVSETQRTTSSVNGLPRLAEERSSTKMKTCCELVSRRQRTSSAMPRFRLAAARQSVIDAPGSGMGHVGVI